MKKKYKTNVKITKKIVGVEIGPIIDYHNQK